MRQVLGPGALGRPRGIGWGRRWEGESGWRIHVNPRLIHVNVWQKPLQYCKVISLQLIKINGKKIKKEREFQKNIYFCLIDCTKAFDCVDVNKVWQILKRQEYQTTLPTSWETCMQVKKQQLELDMEQHTGSILGKKYVKAVYCHPAYLTSVQSTSCKMLGWMNHKLESWLLGEISTTSDMQMTPP